MSSPDCPNVINLAKGLGMNIARPDRMAKIRMNCCQTADTGVTCSSNRVTRVEWSNSGLNGTINGTALPSALSELLLRSNQISGIIPSNLPSSLIHLFVDNNQLNETIPSLPSSLIYLYAYSNNFGGQLPLLPNSLGFLWVFNNNLHGNIPTIPSGIVDFFVFGNKFTGDLQPFNQLGTHILISNPDGGVESNRFTGTLSVNSPHQLLITDNLFTGLVVQSSAILYYCDISNNPLFGVNVTQLTICTKNNLYKINTVSTIVNSALKTSTSSSKQITNIPSMSTTLSIQLTTRAPSATRFAAQTITSNILKAVNFTSTANDNLSAYTGSKDMEDNPQFQKSTTQNIVTLSGSLESPTIAAVGEIPLDVSPNLIFGLIGGFVFCCILLFIARLVFRHPKIHSKFGRTNSFGTLNTVNTVKSKK